MKNKIIFKANGIILYEDSRDLFLNQIDEIKHLISSNYCISYDAIDTETVEATEEVSEIDVDCNGLFDWKSLDCIYLTGVSLPFAEGSDEYLDALANGTLESFLIFV